ncbi:hypothetical protein [Mycolicibacterium sphagni]|uniref:Intersectin-EH binding protein Ibp1 n=1 Tax=Mycolicibacterium sphagni TaxID=1786 RepID=A0A255DQ47_9MYCO|nr:hypothetical protein [Mycolicibacterium sphagni]MCV7175999.1 hypothetical protein [Mycolicibacterium sphagni]OYN81577.1 hypothetical protein CG716_04180 [Mycolicibacterium sphagni]
MPVHSTRARTLFIGGLFALAIAAAPLAHADGGIPSPGPVGPQPVASQPGGPGGCPSGQSMDSSNGNCVPDMSSVGNTQGDDATGGLPTRTTQDITSASDTGVGADLVPNINGDPCSGYWESTVCYSEDQDEVAVQPKSTISSSP